MQTLFRCEGIETPFTPADAGYSGTLGNKRFMWKDGLLGSTLPTCGQPNCGIVLLLLFRFSFLMATMGMIIAENEQTGGAMIAKEDGHIPFPLMPHQITWVAMCVYMLAGISMALAHITPSLNCQLCCKNDAPIPTFYKFAWFAYDVALPGTVTAMIGYAAFAVRNPKDNVWDLRLAIYIMNAITMILDMLFGRMQLFGAHVFTSFAAFVVYVAFLALINPAGIPVDYVYVAIVCVFVYLLVYVVFSNITAFRNSSTAVVAVTSVFHNIPTSDIKSEVPDVT